MPAPRDRDVEWYRVDGLRAAGRGGLFGMPVILDEKSKASEAYKDAVSRLMGEEAELRFLLPEKKSFFVRLFRRSA